MDPVLLKKLVATNGISNLIGYDEKADIWSLGTVCYEMLIGQGVFNAQNMVELVNKVEFGNYHVPTNLSKEVVSFLNGMLQYSAKNRLSAEQLSRHYFLTKNISEFKHIDLTKVCHKIDGNGLNINIKRNHSIWAIFKEEDEKALIDIPGNYLNDLAPIPEIVENPFKKANEKLKQENKNNVVLNNQMIINQKNNNNKIVNGINNLNKNPQIPINNQKEIDYELLRKQQKYYRQLNLKNRQQQQRYVNYAFNNVYPYGVTNNNIYNNYNTVNGQNIQNKYYTTNLQTNAKKQVKVQPAVPIQSATNIQNNQVLLNPQYQYTYTTQPQYITSVANPIVTQPQVIHYGYYQPNSQVSWQTQNPQENKIPQVQKPIIVPNPNDNKSKITNTKISTISSATTKTIPLGKTSSYNNKSYTYLEPTNQQKQKYPYQNPHSSKQLVPKPQTKQIKIRTDQNNQNPIPQTKIDIMTDYKLMPPQKEQKKEEKYPQQNGYIIDQKINQQPQNEYKVETKIIRQPQNEYNLEPRIIRQPQNEYKFEPKIIQEPQDKYKIQQKMDQQPQDKYKIDTKINHKQNEQYQPKFNNYNTNTTHVKIKKLPPETPTQNQLPINGKYHKSTYPQKPQPKLDLELNENEEPKNNLKKLNKTKTKDNNSQSNKNLNNFPSDNWNTNDNQYLFEEYKYEPNNQNQNNNTPYHIKTEPSPSPIETKYNSTSNNKNDLEFKDKDYVIVEEFNNVDIPINDNNKYNENYNNTYNDKYNSDKFNDKYNDKFNDKNNGKFNDNVNDKYNESPIKKNSNEKQKNDNDNDSSSDLDDNLIDFNLGDELCAEPENTEVNKQQNDFDKEDFDSPISKYAEPTVERPTIGVPPPGTDPNDDYDFDNDDNGIFQTRHKKDYDNDDDY